MGNLQPLLVDKWKSEFKPSLSDFEIFKQAIASECIEGSGISDSIFQTCIEFHSDLEVGIGSDLESPIHNALNWTYTRFGSQAKSNLFAAFFLQENGHPWQLKLSIPRSTKDKLGNLKFIKYETPKGGGSIAFLPKVDSLARKAIAKFYNCEIPNNISFWSWLEIHPEIPIIITEGAKKSLCLLSNGYIAIALTGVNGGYRTTQYGISLPAPELIPDLQRFANNRKFVLAFDSDSKPETVRKVNAAIFKTARLLAANGCEVKIARWDNQNGKAKGIDDLIVNCGLAAWHIAYNEAKSLTNWHIYDKYSRRLKHNKPTLVVNVPDLSVAIAPETIPTQGIVGIVSDYGTGKTLLLKALLELEPKVIKVGHRVSLERNAATRLNLSFINDLDSVDGRWLHDKEQRFLTEFESGRLSLCFESLLKIKPEQVRNGDLILDEADQSLRALITSSTCSKDGKRPLLLKHFETLLKAAKRVILLSADLGDRELNYICQLRGESPAMILLNKHKRPRGKLRLIYSSNDSVTVAGIITKAQAGLKLIIPCDSLTRAKAISRLLSQVVGSEKVFEFNSQTSGSPEGLEFASNPDLFLQTYQPQIALITPSGFTGLSMTSGYFDECFGLFYGKSVVTDDCIQALERDRLPIPRTVWAAQFGRAFSKSGEQTNPIELKGNLKKMTDYIGQSLRQELTPEKADSLKHYQWTDNPHLDLYADFETDLNFSMWHFRDCLQVRLEMTGYAVEVVSIESNPETKELIKEAVAAIKLEEAISTAEAVNLTKSEADALEDKLTKNGISPEEQLALDKYNLANWYAIPIESVAVNDVQFDNKGRMRRSLQRLENIMFPDFAADADLKNIDQFAPTDLPATIWDFGHSELQRKTLELIGFYEFLEYAFTGAEWTKETDLVIEITAKCRQYCQDIKLALGFRVNDKMTDVAIIGIILQSIGLKTIGQRRRVNGIRCYFNKLDLEHLSKVVVILNRRLEKATNSNSSVVPYALYNTFSQGIGIEKRTYLVAPNATLCY